MYKQPSGLIPPSKPSDKKPFLTVPPLGELKQDESGRYYFLPPNKSDNKSTPIPDGNSSLAPK